MVALLIVSFRKTFFDIIDERIPFTNSSNTAVIYTVSVADGNIITTSEWKNFNLFAFENSWTERVVEFRGSSNHSRKNLVTVRKIQSDRYQASNSFQKFFISSVNFLILDFSEAT